MSEIYYIFHGFGGENSLMPLAEFMKQRGHHILVVDDQKFPYDRGEMYDLLASIKASYRIKFITCAHLWFDEYNFNFCYNHDPGMISAIELLDFLKPELSVYYPHDMESFMHRSEMKWLDLFDLVLLPYQHNVYYKLKNICKRVEVVGWIKKHQTVSLKVDVAHPVYSPIIFPSNILSFYHQLGSEGYADWFRRYIGPDIPIKMPADDSGVLPILSREGYRFWESSKSVYDAMNEFNLIIGSGHSSIIYEAALCGIPVISLLDGFLPDALYLKAISGMKGVYPLHPEELRDFLAELTKNPRLLETGPAILDSFDFERVYAYLTGSGPVSGLDSPM